MMQLAQISHAVGGQLFGADVALSGVTIDSRGSCEGQLFVALNGERFDGHDYVKQAQYAGAGAILLEKEVESDLPSVLVADTHQALKNLATWWRAQFVMPVIGVTGSVGKTSVKEMLRSIFSHIGKGLVTQGNLNNEIGLPLTLLRLDQDDHYAIIEMGMNHAGEIARLTQITKPTIALINNAAAAHLEGLGNLTGVATAKGEIFEGLSADGIAVINADDQHVGIWRDLIGERDIVSFGLHKQADITATYELSNTGLSMQVTTSEETFDVQLATLGKHNVYNALSAISVAVAANIPIDAIQQGLAQYVPILGRLTVATIGDITVIDDTYNANPASMLAAINVLAQFENTTLIVGDMGEIGDAAVREHRRLGRLANDNKIDRMFACGEFAELAVAEFNGESQAFVTQGDLLNALTERKTLQGVILVKGSRFAKMENVVKELTDKAQIKKSNTKQSEAN